MKIGLITYHKSTSYGACLQAYATQRVLNSLGHKTIIIDYLNKHEQRIKKVFFSSDGSMKSLIKNAIKSIVYRRSHWLKKAFSNFEKEYVLTSKAYYSAKEMEDLSFDMLIVGSDQVWNPKISGGLDPAFLLDFGKTNRRLSLASSFGSYCLKDDEKKFFVERISRFSFISVREQFASKQLESLGFSNAKVICDPTLMLGKSEWEAFAKPTKEDEYILTYFVSNSFAAFRSDVDRINTKKIRIFNVQSSNYHWDGVDKTIIGADPHEFLGLIKGASMIVTDSFHGTVFSILFHKQIAVINNASNPVRIRELLQNLSLECIEYNIYNKVVSLSDEQFDLIDIKIEKIRNETIEWIVQALK